MLSVTAVSSLALAWALRRPALYATFQGPPRELGELRAAHLDDTLAGAWVHAVGAPGPMAAEYRRPLDGDRYRLVPAADAPDLWIELRIPKALESDRYVPPNSFVGRLTRMRDAGPARESLLEAASVVGKRPGDDAWVLLDGETPSTMRWTLGFIGLLLSFFGFSVFGLIRLLRPQSDA